MEVMHVLALPGSIPLVMLVKEMFLQPRLGRREVGDDRW
jgi:hypothetical protein